jgi:hypothetical protein
LKLSSKIDLEPLRQSALDAVDQRFFGAIQRGHFYDTKLQWAKAEIAPDVLISEATIRGLTIDEMRALIINKHSESMNELMLVELQRQKDKASIAFAASEQELKKWLM